RITRSCADEASGMSEKSIPRRRRIGRPLFTARPPRADDADSFAIVLPPRSISHHEHAACRRAAESQESRLLLRVAHVRPVQGIWIAERGRCLFERDPVLKAIARGLPRVPTRTRFSIYETEAADLPLLQGVPCAF